MHFKVIVEHYEPYVNIDDMNDDSITANGPLIDLLKLLASKFNFTYSLCASDDATWGSQNEDGTWTGMIGMLRKHDADIALGPFSLTYERWSAVPTSVPFSVDYAKILVQATHWEMSVFSLYQVFSWEIWVGYFIMCLVVASTLYFNDRMPKRRKKQKRSYLSYLWNLSTILLTQANTHRPRGKVQYMMQFFWDFPVMILTLLLCTSFLSIITLRKINQIETIEAVADQVSIQPIIEKGSSMVNFFRGSKLPVFQQIYKRIELNPKDSILTIKEIEKRGMDLVSEGNFAILKDSSVIKVFLSNRYNNRRPCNYYLSNQNFRTLWKVMAFSPKFPKKLLARINHVLLYVSEFDWLAKRFEEESSGYAECLAMDDAKYRPLAFDDLKGTFLIILLGFICSTVVLALEFMTFRAFRHSKKKRLKKK